jgi:hypothetical protein
MPPSLNDLRRYALSRSLFAPTTLARAIERLGFVQADPIRAPARAQDLILRHRVRDYRAGDLERRYTRLRIEEDFFVNYGFLPRKVQVLMHPRLVRTALTPTSRKRVDALLGHIRQHGPMHPRQIDEYFAHGKVVNYWGGSSNATTHLLDDMHYRGMLRVAKRDSGVRVYAAHTYPPRSADETDGNQPLDALIDLIVRVYAPLPARSFAALVSRLRIAAPHRGDDLPAALLRAKGRLNRGKIAGTDWYWPENEDPSSIPDERESQVQLLAPFDPVVWDRRRFEMFWNWPYRFEAYLPPAKRKLGYYALPMLWRDRVIGWGNVRVSDGKLSADFGYVTGRARRDPLFQRQLAQELERLRTFLSLE